MSKGRPREFDADEALDRALDVFWRQGYEGTTIHDLTAAIGINRPSLYGAFGSKEELFRRVLDRYVAGPMAFVPAALAEPSIDRVVEKLLLGAVEMLSDPSHPPGCLVVHAAPACSEEGEEIRRELCARRRSYEAAVRERFERAKSEGELLPEIDCAGWARFLTALTHGMAVYALAGTTKADLLGIAETALRLRPTCRGARTEHSEGD